MEDISRRADRKGEEVRFQRNRLEVVLERGVLQVGFARVVIKNQQNFEVTVFVVRSLVMNIEFDLQPQDALTWAKDSLCDPLALSFSHCLAKQVDWAKARFFLFGDSSLSRKELLEFRYGGKVGYHQRGTHDNLCADDWLADFLISSGDKKQDFILVEDWLARPTSAFIKEDSMPAVFNGNEVYFVAKLSDLSVPLSKNMDFICFNPVPLFHGFLIHGGVMPTPGDILTIDKMEALCKNVKLIFLGIYDGESYLVCHFGDSKRD